MQRNYPRMFSPADDQDKDGFKLENVVFKFRCRNALKIGCTVLSILVQPFVLQSLLLFL